ncbi:MAG: non-canonical purine NTP pyrophosphatase [Treponema sp.]|nr:non-canonical purine NTP pyrophosphatase [Treponema sp.]
MNIWLASGNKHKQQEMAAIFAANTLRLPSEAGISSFDPEETGSTFAENALIKARTLYRLLKTAPAAAPGRIPAGPVLADDSGLCVDALGGRPGIYSARYHGKDSWDGDGNFRMASGKPEKLTDSERNALLLEELAAWQSAGSGLRSCRFVCAMVLLFSPARFYLVQETLEGEIVASAAEIRGAGGFGYDPIVYLPELGRTVAELSEEEKNRRSHRGRAGRVMAKFLTGD